jgi:diadenosine tetraphosphate (Ap4A) HIT family hydrolase
MVSRVRRSKAQGAAGFPALNRLDELNSSDARCRSCDFSIWRPVRGLSHTVVGLYSDSRFPGRCIVALNEHFDRLEDLPPDTLLGFIMDVRKVAIALRDITACDRVNMAVLGNDVSHVHAHLIPRYSRVEQRPKKSPWNDPREFTPLSEDASSSLMGQISERLAQIQRSSVNFVGSHQPTLF